ncbi:hypothetical protein AB0F17_62145, partial [Nonomuraea sp. NPDC026600]|uniref:hypothetical protein n=1 Tax=Nonomuraea sp. NPDC026600 TaxID=3155363 RepID=UPI0033E53FF2
ATHPNHSRPTSADSSARLPVLSSALQVVRRQQGVQQPFSQRPEEPFDRPLGVRRQLLSIESIDPELSG